MTVARIARALDYAFGVIYVLLGIRIVLALIDGFSYWPFQGIVGDRVIVLPLAICLVTYALLHMSMRALLRVIARS